MRCRKVRDITLTFTDEQLSLMSERQREMARHALGLPNEKHATYRNHFALHSYSDGYEEWTDLVTRGLATVRNGGAAFDAMHFFYLTPRGVRAVLLPHEHGTGNPNR